MLARQRETHIWRFHLAKYLRGLKSDANTGVFTKSNYPSHCNVLAFKNPLGSAPIITVRKNNNNESSLTGLLKLLLCHFIPKVVTITKTSDIKRLTQAVCSLLQLILQLHSLFFLTCDLLASYRSIFTFSCCQEHRFPYRQRGEGAGAPQWGRMKAPSGEDPNERR